MEMYLSAKTAIPDIYIDCIEVELATGEEVMLSWDESHIIRETDGFSVRCKGVYIDEEYANGKITQLEDLRITYIGMNYESDMESDLVVEYMEFKDGEWHLFFKNPEWKLDDGDNKE